jgi:hypothetical protein
MRQVELSRPLVLDAPRHARTFFEALVADNIGIGRPAVVSMVFARHAQRNTQSTFRSGVFTQRTQVRIDFTYKHCRVKIYLKEGCALRIETVVNDPWRSRHPQGPRLPSPTAADGSPNQRSRGCYASCRSELCHRDRGL